MLRSYLSRWIAVIQRKRGTRHFKPQRFARGNYDRSRFQRESPALHRVGGILSFAKQEGGSRNADRDELRTSRRHHAHQLRRNIRTCSRRCRIERNPRLTNNMHRNSSRSRCIDQRIVPHLQRRLIERPHSSPTVPARRQHRHLRVINKDVERLSSFVGAKESQKLHRPCANLHCRRYADRA